MAKKSSTAAGSPGPVPRVSVVIPTRNAGPRFEQTLAAVEAQALQQPFEAIAIDSGSTDGTPERCEAHGWHVIRIRPGAYGHGRTRNQAIAAARGALVALTVQDAVPANAHWLGGLVAALDGAPQAAGAYSRHLPHPGAGFVARFVAEYWYQHQGGRVEQRIADRAAFERLSFEEKRLACTFNDVSSIVRRSVWEAVPFREIAFAEDLAWGYDVLRAGHSVIYEPASQVYHSHERPLGFEFRRAYVDGRVVGELFDAPAALMSFPHAARLPGLWRHIVARARAYGDGSAPSPALRADWERLAAQLRLPVRDREWYAQRFGLAVLARIVGPESPWPRREQYDIMYRLEHAASRSGAASLEERLKDAVNWLEDWQIEAGWTQRPTVSREQRLSAVERRTLFDALWDEIGRDYVRRAVLEAENARPHSEACEALLAATRAHLDPRFPALEERLHATASGMLQSALAADELTVTLYREIWRYVGAIVIGQRLGEANRYGLAGRWGAVLQSCLPRGI